jgi:hypothetical protein
MVLSAMPSSSSLSRNLPMCMSCSTMPSEYSSWPEMPRSSSLTWVRKCMRVPLHQTRTRACRPWCCSLDEVDGGGEVSSSTVSMRFLVSGPVSSIFCPSAGPGVDHAARAELLAEGLAVGQHHVAGVVLVLRLLLGVEVVEVAEELVEAVVGRQVLVAVAEVVLAELAGGVALALSRPAMVGSSTCACPPRRRAGRPWTGRCGTRSGR